MTRRQCAKCPWKVSTNPHDIPDGYCPTKHANLATTIREGPRSMGTNLRIMVCHETHKTPCAGWLANQLQNNNLGLRLEVARGRIDADVELVGGQHSTFEDTLP